MANPEINLSTSTRANLLALTRTTDLIARTQERLSTGLKVNSAIDDAISFFQARSLSDRASDLTLLKSNIDLGINTLEVASTGVESISGVVEQMKGLALAAKADTSTATVSYTHLTLPTKA